jgi:hypothetical protein
MLGHVGSRQSLQPQRRHAREAIYTASHFYLLLLAKTQVVQVCTGQNASVCPKGSSVGVTLEIPFILDLEGYLDIR